MVSIERARKLAMSLPDVEERDHFGSPSFRVKSKIFAQLSSPGSEARRALVKLASADQAALLLSAPEIFSSVLQWGNHGWTYVELAAVKESVLRDLLWQSWRLVAPKNLARASDGAKAKTNRRDGRAV